jgi:rubrerythrin
VVRPSTVPDPWQRKTDEQAHPEEEGPADALAELAVRFEHTEDAVQWLETTLPELEGRTPREAIAAGEIERVTLLLEAMNDADSSATA